MRRFFNVTSVAALVASLALSVSAERTFDRLFRINGIEGECWIRKPNAPRFAPAEESHAYPYGTKVKTGLTGSLTVNLSDDDKVLVYPNSLVEVTWPKPGSEKRIINFIAGSMRTFLTTETLGEGEDISNVLFVVTPTAECDRITGTVLYKLKPKTDATALTINAEDGTLRVTGPQFSVSEVERTSRFSIVTANDESYTNLSNLRGTVAFALAGGTDGQKMIETRKGSLVKIWRRRAPLSNRLIVSVLGWKPSGYVLTSYTFREGQASDPTLDVAEEVSSITGNPSEFTAETTGAPAESTDADDSDFGDDTFGDDIFDQGF